VKRILTTLLILAALVGVAQADYVQSWGPKPIGYLATLQFHGTQACTLAVPLSVIQNAKWLVFDVYAESIIDSVPNLQASFGFKHLLTTANAWVNTSFATGDAGDTILPLDSHIRDTLTTQTVLLPHYSTLWSIPGATARIIFTGKRASQAAKAGAVIIYAKR
jgi:hypothetical protein